MAKSKEPNDGNATAFDVNADVLPGVDNPARDANGGIIDGVTVVDPAGTVRNGSGNAGSVGSNGSGGTSGSGDAGTVGKRGRGRPRGSRAANKKTAQIDISGLEILLFSTHTLLASITKVPELAIEEIEAKILASSCAKVARHYNVAVTEKTLDWINLSTALATVYGTRLIAAVKRNRDEKIADRPSTVVDMHGTPLDKQGKPINPLDEPLNPPIT